MKDIRDDSIVTLIPVAMIRPTDEWIYAPSKLRPTKPITYLDFKKKYARWSRKMLVSFDEDGKSNPKLVDAYGIPMQGYYVRETTQ